VPQGQPSGRFWKIFGICALLPERCGSCRGSRVGHGPFCPVRGRPYSAGPARPARPRQGRPSHSAAAETKAATEQARLQIEQAEALSPNLGELPPIHLPARARSASTWPSGAKAMRGRGSSTSRPPGNRRGQKPEGRNRPHRPHRPSIRQKPTRPTVLRREACGRSAASRTVRAAATAQPSAPTL
jgi:hypothetical protein